MEINELSSMIIKSSIRVHTELGPGLLESVYRSCLAYELRLSGLSVKEELVLPISYRGVITCGDAFRLDLLVNDLIVVELKSVEIVKPVHLKQLLTYLRLAKKPLGLLINFNESLVKNGIVRVANNLETIGFTTGVIERKKEV